MKMIVGLGNPGPQYAETRHNAGAWLVEALTQQEHLSLRVDSKFSGATGQIKLSGHECWVLIPTTYMNLSGKSVASIVNYYHLKLENLLVVSDDADLPLGSIRMRPSGGSGGHHGLESIEQALGTQNYARLRIGIGRQSDDQREITDYVLSAFSPQELKILDLVLERAVKQVNSWLLDGIEKAMNQYNGQVECPQ